MASADSQIQLDSTAALKHPPEPPAQQAKLRPTDAIGCRAALQSRAVQSDSRTPRMQGAIGFWGASHRVRPEALNSAGETRSKGRARGGLARTDTCPSGL